MLQMFKQELQAPCSYLNVNRYNLGLVKCEIRNLKTKFSRDTRNDRVLHGQ